MSLPQDMLDQFRYSGAQPGNAASPANKRQKRCTTVSGEPSAAAALRVVGANTTRQGNAAKKAVSAEAMSKKYIMLSDEEDFEVEQNSTGRPAANSHRAPRLGAISSQTSSAVDQFVNGLRSINTYSNQIVHVQKFPSRAAKTKELENFQYLRNKHLKKQIIDTPLYVHQAEAIDAVFEGQNVVVATGTASGKSRCYLVPTMEALSANSNSRALFLFPIKALAHDQLRATKKLAEQLKMKRVNIGCYDSDTAEAERAKLRNSGRIIMSNPDMLHFGILPNHRLWEKMLKNLTFVVIDEAHTYRGVFGSQMALLMRRLLRLCRHYGSEPQFILLSATIANPKELATKLIGAEAKLVDRSRDGSPSGERTFLLWNPPLLDADGTRRRSAAVEATQLMTEAAKAQLRNICFVRARRTAELVLQQTRNRLQLESRNDLIDRIQSYRAGYLATERRQIENELSSGRVLGVAATSALELGVDIGCLDATIHVGWPGSIASMWQQAGRAGRSGQPCISILIGLSGALDQYYMKHPSALFESMPEEVTIDHTNPCILGPQLVIAAAELPLTEADAVHFGGAVTFAAAMHELSGSGALKNTIVDPNHPPLWEYVGSEAHPHGKISIRGSQMERVTVVNRGKEVETIDLSQAHRQLHEGAIYLHQSQSFLITKLDLRAMVAEAKAADDCSYYTESTDVTELEFGKPEATRSIGATTIHLGPVLVKSQVVGFVKKQIYTDAQLGDEIELDLPASLVEAKGVWWEVPQIVCQKLVELGRVDGYGAVSGVANTSVASLPTLISCDRRDVSARPKFATADDEFAPPTICIYETFKGGVGIAEKVFQNIEEIWRRAEALVQTCSCSSISGCPSCLQSPQGRNEGLHKAATALILRGLLFESKGTTSTALVTTVT